MRSRRLLPAVATFILALCPALSVANPPAGPHAGDSAQTMAFGGVQRTYVLHLPTGYQKGSRALPLVLVLHGHGGRGASFEHSTKMDVKADAEHFIAVFPDALGTIDGRPAWNTGIKDDPGVNSVDDVGFLRALIDKLQGELRVDPKRIYACGFSNGGIMTYRLGAELSDKLAAIGVASGTIGSKPPDGPEKIIPTPKYPLPVIHFHGKKDPVVSYDGTGGHDGGVPTYTMSVADSIAFWVKVDHCATPPHETTAQQGNLVRDDYDHCAGSNEVLLLSFGNGTHEWPSLANNDHFSATDAVWKFFSQHPKP